MADRSATTIWEGGLDDGHGRTTLDSSGLGTFEVSWPARTRDEADGMTSPEELIAAAHASCFSMALSKALADGGNAPERLETSAVATFSTDGGPHVAGIKLTVRGRVPGISEDDFRDAAEAAKDGCPISKTMAGNVPIELEAQLV